MKKQLKKIMTISLLSVTLTLTATPLTSFANEVSNIQTRAIDHGGAGVTLPWYCRQFGTHWGNIYAARVNLHNAINGVNIFLPYCPR
ncbi:MAG: hypothetical protein ACRC17_11290 [Culicoidibacterales bacterium]